MLPPDGGSAVDLGKLTADVERLIATARAEFAVNPFDSGIQQRLKALLDLQTILKSQQLPPEQLRLIQDQLIQLSPAPPLTATPVPASAVPQLPQQPVPPTQSSATPIPQLFQQPPPVAGLPPMLSGSLASLLQQFSTSTPPTATPAQPATNPTPLSQLFPPATPHVPPPMPSQQTSLAALLQQFAPTPTPTNPPAAPISVPPPSAPSVPSAGTLLEALRAQGLLPSAPPSVPPLPVPPISIPTSSLASLVPPIGGSWPPPKLEYDVELTTASIKKYVIYPLLACMVANKISRPRPHLIESLYSAFSNQCTTCGRRFANTPEGKQKKARHMDWHFKVKDPDLAKRGIHRSWYISEKVSILSSIR